MLKIEVEGRGAQRPSITVYGFVVIEYFSTCNIVVSHILLNSMFILLLDRVRVVMRPMTDIRNKPDRV